jgi:hypothetical protein
MYKFTVEYYFERYHTGAINPNRTREAIVFANTKGEAINKIIKADAYFIGTAKVKFEEVERTPKERGGEN